MIWLSADPEALGSSGEFWHERMARDIDMSSSTRKADTPDKRQTLWQWCEEHTHWQFNT